MANSTQAGAMVGQGEEVRLTFINESNDANSSQIVIFSGSAGAGPDGAEVVGVDEGPGDHHRHSSPIESPLSDRDAGEAFGSKANPGQRLTVKPGSIVQHKVVLDTAPTIWIGVTPPPQHGAIIDGAILSGINTEISLQGVASADVVMTGGGTGPGARPFQFTLANVVPR